MTGLKLTPGYVSKRMTRARARLVGSSPEWESSTDDKDDIRHGSFKERGFRFIPIRPAHMRYIAAVMGRSGQEPEFDQVAGNCMVDENYLPLGFCLAYFEDIAG